MNRSQNEAELSGEVRGSRTSEDVANCFDSNQPFDAEGPSSDNVSSLEPIFVRNIPVYPSCQAMSSYARNQHFSSNKSEKSEQARYSARVANVGSKQSQSRTRQNDRHCNKRSVRIDLRPGQRTGDISSSQHDRFNVENYGRCQHRSSLPTCSRMNSDDCKGLLEAEPLDICQPASTISGVLHDSLDAKDSKNQNEKEDGEEETRNRILRPGMVLLKRYLTISEQINIVKTCRELGQGPNGFYQPMYRDGRKLHLQMMCLGLHWNHLTREYGDQRPDGLHPPSIPSEFSLLVEKAVQDAHALITGELRVSTDVEDILPGISPNICIVNFYTSTGRLGLHQDRDESAESLRITCRLFFFRRFIRIPLWRSEGRGHSK